MSRRRRRLMLAGALGAQTPATIVDDTFTDANATALTAHIGEIGASWTHYSGADAAAIQDNRVYGGDGGAYIASGVPSNANYYVEALIDLLTDLGTDNVGVIGRAVVGADSYYLARYAASNDSWALFRVVSGAAQQIGSTFTDDWTIGLRVVRLDMQGNTIRLLTNGVERISVVDNTFTEAGRAGLRWGAVQASTTGRHITQLVAFGPSGSASEFLVILAAGQSNLPGRQTVALGGSLISPDDDPHIRVYKYTGTGTLTPITMPLVFPDGATYDANVTPAFAYAKLVADANPGSKIVILPFARGGTGIDEWVAGSLEFDAMADAWDESKAEFSDSALHSVIVSNLEHEMAAGTATATVATLLDAMIAAVRALPGASSVPIYLGVPVPEWVTSEDERDILLEGAKAAVRNSNVGIIGGVVAGGGLAGDGNLHYANAANRTRGAWFYDQIARTAAFNSAAPATVTVHGLVGETLTFTSVGAPYYDIQTSPVGAGTWTSNDWSPNQDNSPGPSFSLTLPGSGSRDYRIVAKAKGGDSTSSVGTYTAAGAAALIARMSPAPDGARQTLIENFFAASGIADVLTKLDFLHVYAAHDAQASRLNWVSSSFDATEVGTLTHTVDRGFAGNGANGYLNTNFNPTTAAGQYTQNSAHIGVWSRTGGVVTVIDFGARAAANTNQASMQLRTTSNAANFRLNVGTSPSSGSVADATGHFVTRRSASNAWAAFRNAVSIQSSTNASVAPPNLNLFVGSLNDNGTPNTFSTREYAAAHAGGNLTDQNITDLYNALQTYMTAVGA